MEYILIQMGEVANEVIVFDVEISEEKNKSFSMNMFLMPEPKSVKKILEGLGML